MVDDKKIRAVVAVVGFRSVQAAVNYQIDSTVTTFVETVFDAPTTRERVSCRCVVSRSMIEGRKTGRLCMVYVNHRYTCVGFQN